VPDYRWVVVASDDDPSVAEDYSDISFCPNEEEKNNAIQSFLELGMFVEVFERKEVLEP